jgi:hypothetical protein
LFIVHCSLFIVCNFFSIKHRKIHFEYNPFFDPTKDPWDEGGICLPEKQENTRPEVVHRTAAELAKKSSEDEIIMQVLPSLGISRIPATCQNNVVGGVYFDGSPAFGIAGGNLEFRVSVGNKFELLVG